MPSLFEFAEEQPDPKFRYHCITAGYRGMFYGSEPLCRIARLVQFADTLKQRE